MTPIRPGPCVLLFRVALASCREHDGPDPIRPSSHMIDAPLARVALARVLAALGASSSPAAATLVPRLHFSTGRLLLS